MTSRRNNMKKIAIMGARGFVGKALTAHLQDKYTVYPITREQFSLLDEQAVTEFFEKENIDVVFHCANQGGSRKTGYDVAAPDVIGNNLKMFFNMERCLKDGMKLINFGSGAQYNKARDLVKVKEDTIGTVIPKDDYGYSKYVMSEYLGVREFSNKQRFVGVEQRFENCGNRRPENADGDCRKQHDDNHHAPRHFIRHVDHAINCRKAAHQHLTVGAHVPVFHTERGNDGKPERKQQSGILKKRPRIDENALYERAENSERVASD